MTFQFIRQLLFGMSFLIWITPAAQSQSTIIGNFTFDGINRSYRLYVPASYVHGVPAPLLFNLHGYGSNNIEQELYGDFRPIADTAGFLLVHPNGTLDFNNTLHWNTFGTSNVNDVGFLSALIDSIASVYSVDSQRVYSTGMSNGGFMSFALACNLSSRIAAVASVTGSMTNVNLGACLPSKPVPVMQIHGTADATVPYNGNFFFAAVPAVLNFWVSANVCNTQPIITPVPDINPNDGSTAELYVYHDGLSGTEVQHYKITGGGHSWPGAPININSTNMDFSASAVIWNFFRRYNLDGIITSSSKINYSAMVSYGPNPASGITWIRFAETSQRQIQVFDVYGRLIERKSTNENETIIHFPSRGIYLIEVSDAVSRQVIKILNN